MVNDNSTFSILAIYKFFHGTRPNSEDLRTIKVELLEVAVKYEIKGTLLLADEGLNGTICMPKEHADAVNSYFSEHELWNGCRLAWSEFHECVFHRMFVKIKKEIVSMGINIENDNESDVNFNEQLDGAANNGPGHQLAGKYIKSMEWDSFLRDNPDVDLIDCRNSYEVKMGTFKGAIDPGTDIFTQFPEWLQKFGKGENIAKPKKIAMFCTGGIRCEKSTALAKKMTNVNGNPLFVVVYHLEGGILSYLDKVVTGEETQQSPKEDIIKDSTFEGECFVFDQRVSVREGLHRGTYSLCHGCRAPLSKSNVHHPTFIRGVQCVKCSGNADGKESDTQLNKRSAHLPDKHLERQIERQRQFELAQKKGKDWGDACKEFAQIHSLPRKVHEEVTTKP